MVAIFVVSAQLVLKFGIVTTALAGGYMMVSGSLDIFVFIAFLIVISRLYDPLNNALQNLAAMINAEYNMERLQEIADQPVQGGSSEFRPDGYDIVFDHVRFSYDGERDVLRDVSFTARQGEVTAIIGPSGEGKTLLSCYSIVFQDVTLFNTTVMDNIRIGRRGATDEEVMSAARAANCDDFVSRLPEGYMTVIGENGAKLSGGERQRISIARALLKDAPIILLDEATASLDTECETQVQQAISELHDRGRGQDRRAQGRHRGGGRQPGPAHGRGRDVLKHGAPAEQLRGLDALRPNGGATRQLPFYTQDPAPEGR